MTREAATPDGSEAAAARDRPGDGTGRDERWAGLPHVAACYATRAVAEGRLRLEARRGPARGFHETDVVGAGLLVPGGRG